jgi:hypothetical protein
MDLTGRENGPPLFARSCVASCANAALDTFAAVSGSTRFDGLSGAQLLGERAAIAGHRRRGRIAAGGSCRLLRARDNWIAVNLAREEDIALLPAWLETDSAEDVWTTIETQLARRDADEMIARGRELGLPLARLAEIQAGTHWTRIALRGRDREPESNALPLVIDLSSLWAGPLATHLFEQAGARVIKVESKARPDGARRGPIEFYDLLNAGKQSVALDFTSHDDLAVLDQLLRRADIVVEASRPRALRQLGFAAEEFLRTVPGLTWLSITGYGRDEPTGDRVAFGDDAAVAGGLVADDDRDGTPVFCGDAIADPLTGLHAALAAYGSWRIGGGRLLDIAMSRVAAHVRGFAQMPDAAALSETDDGYEVTTQHDRVPVSPPQARAVERRAAALGEHTRMIIEELC